MQNELDELGVVGRIGEALDEQVRRFRGAQRTQQLAQNVHSVQLGLGEQELLLARARLVNVDGREDAPLGQPAVQMQLAVAGALELFVDDVVGPAARLDERGGDNRQAAAFLDVAGRAEKALRAPQRRRV